MPEPTPLPAPRRTGAPHIATTASTERRSRAAPAGPRALTPHQMVARRIARTASGGVLLAGAIALVATVYDGRTDGHHQLGAVHVCAAQILCAAWLAATVAGLATYAVVVRLRRWPVLDVRLETSWVVPVFAIALLAPLTLHLFVAVLIRCADPRAFDGWVAISLPITGITHAVFAARCVRRTRQLIAGEREVISPMRIYGDTVVASCLPFVVLIFLPPILVALTGLPILPLLSAMKPAIERELAMLPHPLPRATAAIPRGASSRPG